MAATRRADVIWEGELQSGSGRVSAATSKSFRDLGVSWSARTEGADGRTSPEELLAAAHASCFAMQLSANLARGGTPPKRLEVSAAVTFDKVDGSWRVTTSQLEVRGSVPGSDDARFRAAVEAAKDGCPISQALKGNVQVSVEAVLQRESALRS